MPLSSCRSSVAPRRWPSLLRLLLYFEVLHLHDGSRCSWILDIFDQVRALLGVAIPPATGIAASAGSYLVALAVHAQQRARFELQVSIWAAADSRVLSNPPLLLRSGSGEITPCVFAARRLRSEGVGSGGLRRAHGIRPALLTRARCIARRNAGAHPARATGARCALLGWPPNSRDVRVIRDFGCNPDSSLEPRVAHLVSVRAAVGDCERSSINHVARRGARMQNRSYAGSRIRRQRAAIIWDLDRYTCATRNGWKAPSQNGWFESPLSVYALHLDRLISCASGACR